VEENNWTYELIDKPVIDEMAEMFDVLITESADTCWIIPYTRLCFFSTDSGDMLYHVITEQDNGKHFQGLCNRIEKCGGTIKYKGINFYMSLFYDDSQMDFGECKYINIIKKVAGDGFIQKRGRTR